MYFDGYDFEMNAYKIMHISFVANRIVYVDGCEEDLLLFDGRRIQSDSFHLRGGE